MTEWQLEMFPDPPLRQAQDSAAATAPAAEPALDPKAPALKRKMKLLALHDPRRPRNRHKGKSP